MTPALRTAILDALMERWREAEEHSEEWPILEEDAFREYLSSCLDMILPVAEPMIRKAALREAAGVVRNDAMFSSDPNVSGRAGRLADVILALGEPK